MAEDLRGTARLHHREPRPGKLESTASKPPANQRDRAPACPPGGAAACEAVATDPAATDPAAAAHVTRRANLVAAAVANGLKLTDRMLAEARLVSSGVGAAAPACVDLLIAMGPPTGNVTPTDIDGIVHNGRPRMNPYIERHARNTMARTLADALPGTDIFPGFSVPGVLTPSSQRAGRTTRTGSATSCASRSSSAVRSTSAPRRSTRR